MSDISQLLDNIEEKIDKIDKLLRPIRTKISNNHKDLNKMENWIVFHRNNKFFLTIQISNSYDTEDIYDIKLDKQNINILNKSNKLIKNNLVLIYIIKNTNDFFDESIKHINNIIYPMLCIYDTLPISIHYNFKKYIEIYPRIFKDENINNKLLIYYNNIINVRGNGACFYRAVLYSLFISLYQHNDKTYVFNCLIYLKKFFNDIVFNDFFNKFEIIITKKLSYIYLYILYCLYDLLLIVKCKQQLINIIEFNKTKEIIQLNANGKSLGHTLNYYVNKIVLGKTVLNGLRYQNELASDIILELLPYILGCNSICIVKNTHINILYLKEKYKNINIYFLKNEIQEIQEIVLPNINIFHIDVHFLTLIPINNDIDIISKINFTRMNTISYIQQIISGIPNKFDKWEDLLSKIKDPKKTDLIILLIKEYFKKFIYTYDDIYNFISNIKGYNIINERVVKEVFIMYIKNEFIDKKDKLQKEIENLLKITNRSSIQRILLNAYNDVKAYYKNEGYI